VRTLLSCTNSLSGSGLAACLPLLRRLCGLVFSQPASIDRERGEGERVCRLRSRMVSKLHCFVDRNCSKLNLERKKKHFHLSGIFSLTLPPPARFSFLCTATTHQLTNFTSATSRVCVAEWRSTRLPNQSLTLDKVSSAVHLYPPSYELVSTRI
jgi:hypothetical protein